MISPTSLQFFKQLRWIDGRPLLDVIEPYRQRIFAEALDARDFLGRPKHNLALMGRAKKNWKSADLILAALYRLLAWDSPGGNQCYILANDLGQADDDLELAKKIIRANPVLRRACHITKTRIERRDGTGFLEILPAQDIVGTHGKTYSFCGFDEIHGYRNWDILEAMQLDPTRPDALMWITSYASLYHKPGAPLFDLMRQGKAGTDPRMYFSWYGGDHVSDPAYADADPETRANPSLATFSSGYLAQQRSRLPSHKFRRLHLNLPGLPEGSAFQPEPVMGAITRGIPVLPPEPGIDYAAFVDMSGGSNEDAVLAIGYRDVEGRAVVSRVLNQGQPPPFDPVLAVDRFVAALKEYRVYALCGDAYAGNTFQAAYESRGVGYEVSDLPKSKLFEAMEAPLNGGRVLLPDQPKVEEQLLGLVWKGGKIDHPAGEKDDFANAVAGVVHVLLGGAGADLPAPEAVDDGTRVAARGPNYSSPFESYTDDRGQSHSPGDPDDLARVDWSKVSW